MKRITFTGSSFTIDGCFPILGQATWRTYAVRVSRDGMILGLKERQVIGKVLDEHILELDCHGRPTMHLHGEHPVQGPAFFVEIDEIAGGMSINPGTVTIALNQNAVFMPLTRGKILYL